MTVYTKTATYNFDLRLTVTMVSQSVANNTSTIKRVLEARISSKAAFSMFNQTFPYVLTGGATKSGSVTDTFVKGDTSWHAVVTDTGTVDHAANGTGSVTV